MPIRNATAVWEGGLRDGQGQIALGSGAFEGVYSFAGRFENGSGTNPEELIGAAHAGCFSMALALMLEKAGFRPQRIESAAKVHIDKVGEGFKITRIDLTTDATVPGIDEQSFRRYAEDAKNNCPVSQALAGTQIQLQATLSGASAAAR